MTTLTVLQTHTLPHFVEDYYGGTVVMTRASRGTYLCEGVTRPMLLINARDAHEARMKIRDHVARVAPKTDRRRKHWEYS